MMPMKPTVIRGYQRQESDELPSKPSRRDSSSCPNQQQEVVPHEECTDTLLGSHYLIKTPKTTRASITNKHSTRKRPPYQQSPDSVLHFVLQAPQRKHSFEELDEVEDQQEQDYFSARDGPLTVPERRDSISIESWGRRSRGSLSSISSLGWHGSSLSSSLSSSLVWSKTSLSNLETIDESRYGRKSPPSSHPYGDGSEDKQINRSNRHSLKLRPKLGISLPSCPNGFSGEEDDSISTLGWNNSSSDRSYNSSSFTWSKGSLSNLQTINERKRDNPLPSPTDYNHDKNDEEEEDNKQDLKDRTSQRSYNNQNSIRPTLGISSTSYPNGFFGQEDDSISTLGWNNSIGSTSSSFTWTKTVLSNLVDTIKERQHSPKPPSPSTLSHSPRSERKAK